MESIYTKISKKIGHIGIIEPWPNKAEALKLWREVAYEHSEEAFEKVFRIWRFSTRPTNQDESEVMLIIVDAFHEGSRIFQNQDAALVSK